MGIVIKIEDKLKKLNMNQKDRRIKLPVNSVIGKIKNTIFGSSSMIRSASTEIFQLVKRATPKQLT